MSFGKVLLVVAWIVSFEVNCSVCCSNGDCSLYTNEDDCDDAIYSNLNCKWESSGTCRDWTCADLGDDQQGCLNADCAWNGTSTTCKEVTSCSQLTSGQCARFILGDNTCGWIGGACKAVTCDDYKTSESTCEDAWILKGHCQYLDSASSCTLKTSCGDWTARGKDDCEKNNRCVDSGKCVFAEGVCRLMSCSDISSEWDCLSVMTWNRLGDKYGYFCKWTGDEDGTCTNATSCSDFNGKNKAMCTTNSLGCSWDEVGKICSSKNCESLGNGKNKCYAELCYYLDSCTVADPSPSSSSAIFAPMFLLIAAILTLVF